MTNENKIIMIRLVELRNQLDKFDDITLKKLKSLYELSLDDLLKRIKSLPPGSVSGNRLTLLINELTLTLKSIQAKIVNSAVNDISTAGLYAYQETENILSWDHKLQGFNNLALSQFQMKEMIQDHKLGNKTLDEWIGNTLLPHKNEIITELQKYYIKGVNPTKIAKIVKDNLKLDNDTLQDLTSIIKTYTQSINVKAQEEIYNSFDNVVKGVEWSALMEKGNTKTGRGTCPRCAALDGNIYNLKSKDKPPMPLHVRCRCVWKPVTKSWEELGFDLPEMEKTKKKWLEREGKSRKLTAYGYTDKDYTDLYYSRSDEWQDSVVGPVRAEMIRNEIISFKDIVIDDKSYLKKTKQVSNRSYELGDLILIEDLKKMYDI